VGSKNKQPPPPPPSVLKRLAPLARLGKLQTRWIIAGVVLLAVAISFRIAWQRWGEPSLNDPAYQLSAERIVVTPQPQWIQGDVKADVVRDAQLADLNIRDKQLLDKVTRAFALHSWVAKVSRVEKRYPAEVLVDLEYRKPVAMVEIFTGDKPGLLFIDEQSILLPSEDFAVAQTRNYLRISAGDTLPTGVYGTPWGSRRVLGAAKIAAAWGDRWKPLGLYRIVVKEDPNAEPIYELHTKNEARVIWGKPPGEETHGEPAAADKMEFLAQLVKQQGPLDKSAKAKLIDLRHPIAPQTPAHTAGGREAIR
jgi:hypothetical protein